MNSQYADNFEFSCKQVVDGALHINTIGTDTGLSVIAEFGNDGASYCTYSFCGTHFQNISHFFTDCRI